jgi:8-oxo-dGTP pyrophosphatase MutT (NUDIX family)
MIYDVFQKGLIHGAEHLAFDPEKAYAYVEHPIEGWRVYLRSCVFLHTKNNPSFLVVKRTGSNRHTRCWEPPKGQMEGKELGRSIKESLMRNAVREVEEEAHIELTKVYYTGLIYQSREKTYPANHYFQYHIFRSIITEKSIKKGFDTFNWIKEHPIEFSHWKRDKKEKDDLAWFEPHRTKIQSRWAPYIISLYLKSYPLHIY